MVYDIRRTNIRISWLSTSKCELRFIGKKVDDEIGKILADDVRVKLFEKSLQKKLDIAITAIHYALEQAFVSKETKATLRGFLKEIEGISDKNEGH